MARAHRPVPLAGGRIALTSDLPGLPRPHLLLPEGGVTPLGDWPERTVAVVEAAGGLILAHDAGGNEAWQLSCLDLATGSSRPLTGDPAAIHRSLKLDPAGGRLGLAHNPGGRRDFALSALDIASGALETWLDLQGMWSWTAWSPDGDRAAAALSAGSTRTHAFLIRPGGQHQPVLPQARRAEVVAWLDGGRLLVITDLDSDFLGLAVVEASRPEVVAGWLARPAHDVTAVIPEPAGSRAVLVVNAGFHDGLSVVDLDSGAELAAVDLPRGVVYTDNVTDAVSEVAWDGAAVLLAWETATAPAEVHRIDLAAQTVTRLTFTGGNLAAVEPVETEYESFDGLRVPALHFRGAGDRPAVVWFHGGPEGQFRRDYQVGVQYLLARGLDVLAPNVRGSDGYGLRYLSLDDRERRWDSVRDGCAAARHLLETGAATAVAAMGASYGGYMTLAVLVEAPGLWAAGVDIVGVADLVTFMRNTSVWRRTHRASEYGDPDAGDEEWMAGISPARRAGRIRAPLLILHGRNDPRVPLSEAVQLAAAAPQAELHVYDDEGHGLVKHRNRVDGYGRAADFLVRHLTSKGF